MNEKELIALAEQIVDAFHIEFEAGISSSEALSYLSKFENSTLELIRQVTSKPLNHRQRISLRNKLIAGNEDVLRAVYRYAEAHELKGNDEYTIEFITHLSIGAEQGGLFDGYAHTVEQKLAAIASLYQLKRGENKAIRTAFEAVERGEEVVKLYVDNAHRVELLCQLAYTKDPNFDNPDEVEYFKAMVSAHSSLVGGAL